MAVLRLDRPVHYMPHIAPICLPEKNEDFLGQYGWAAGWGALQAGKYDLYLCARILSYHSLKKNNRIEATAQDSSSCGRARDR